MWREKEGRESSFDEHTHYQDVLKGAPSKNVMFFFQPAPRESRLGNVPLENLLLETSFWGFLSSPRQTSAKPFETIRYLH